MFTVVLIASVLVIVCVIFHGFWLQLIARKLFFQIKEFSFSRIGLLILAAILAHLVEILLFQVAYIWLIPMEQYGSIIGVAVTDTHEWRDMFYFSAVTYTSTGYGDLTPTGNLRLLATIEALTGLIMTAWTASFAFLVMQLYWRENRDKLKPD